MKIINISILANKFFNFAKYAIDRPLPLKPPGFKAKPPEPTAFSPSITGTRSSPVPYKKKIDNYLDTVEVIKKSPKKEEHEAQESKPVISKSDRITTSYEEFDPSRFILSRDENMNNNKPNAFYYAFGNQWINERFLTKGNVYSLDLDMSKIFQLTPESLQEFVDKYCYKISTDDMISIMIRHKKISPTGVIVNWRKFKKDYGGMEIENLESIKSEDDSLGIGLSFLDTVDVDGGFFWDKSVLLKAEKVGKIEEDGSVVALDPVSYILDEGSIVEVRKSNSEDHEQRTGGEYIFFEEEEKREEEKKLREMMF